MTIIDPTDPEVWASLTSEQRTQATIIMWEDCLVMDTMQLIHGKEAGRTKALDFLGY